MHNYIVSIPLIQQSYKQEMNIETFWTHGQMSCLFSGPPAYVDPEEATHFLAHWLSD